MEGGPLVSVITPVRDAADTLAETVASVRAQTRGDWEMLLIDDGSTDGSAALAAGFAAADPRTRALPLGPPLGTAAARNRGIAAARGRYIAFLDADDLWRPEKLARQIPLKFVGEPNDIANAVLYLASDESRFMTGAELKLDGGISAM